MSRDVIVVGAGVIGLTCALVLVENGYRVKIIADHFPTDPLSSTYTSSWAGAHFRPYPCKNELDKEVQILARTTQRYFRRLAVEEAESSIKFIEGVEYFETPKETFPDIEPSYDDEMEDFRLLLKEQLPEGVEWGTRYVTWVLNAPLYIQYLQRKLTMKYGVEFVKSNLVSLKQVFDLYQNDIVVNATGRGLQYNGGYDPKSFVIRGQTLLVRPPKDCPYLNKTVTHQSKDGKWTFVIPRPSYGGVILGGTKQVNDLHPFPKTEDSEELKERAQRLYPELFINGELDIKMTNVGFRPARKDGLSVTKEKIGEDNIIHAYGAGGLGYEISYGVGMKVLELIKSISKLSKL